MFIFTKEPRTLQYLDFSILEDFHNPSQDDLDNWFNTISDLPNPQSLINLNLNIDNNSEFLLLEGNFEWKQEDKFGEKYWSYPKFLSRYQIRSYIVNKNDLKKIIKLLKYKNFNGRWMPECSEFHNIFNREFYQKIPPYLYEYTYHENNKKYILPENKIEVCVPTFRFDSYINQESGETEYNRLKINNKLFNDLQLKYKDYNEIYYSKNDELIGFNTFSLGSSKDRLLINKKTLLNYLNQNNLEIFFTVLGEKVCSKSSGDNEHLNVSGFYYFNNEQLEEEFNCFSKYSYAEMSGSLLGLVKENEEFNNFFIENGKCYFNENNKITYYFIESSNKDHILSKFDLSDKNKNKKINNLSWKFDYFRNEKEINDKILKNILECGNGFLGYTYANEKYYFVIIQDGNTSFNKDPYRTNLFKKYVEGSLSNIKISKIIPKKKDDEYSSEEMDRCLNKIFESVNAIKINNNEI
jgi:hypothetical protein